MSKQLARLNNSYNNLIFQIQLQNDSIQNTISEALKDKNSFIQDFQFDIDDYNLKNHTVNVSFEVTPKKINKNDTMTLHFQDNNKKDIYVDLTLSKNLYTGKVALPLTNYKNVNILLKNTDTTLQMSLEIYLKLLDKFALDLHLFPGINPSFYTENNQNVVQYDCYGSHIMNDHEDASTVLVDGKLKENYFNSLIFELYVNDELVDTQDGFKHEPAILKGNIQTSDHVVLKETLTDELGITYHVPLSDFIVSNDINQIDREELLTSTYNKIEIIP